MSDLEHRAVIHPGELLATEKRAASRVNDWLATHLAVVFGAVWTVWVFFTWPLAAQFLSPVVQVKTSYYAQSWVQLFALPLFVWVGNRLQRSSDAQSDAQHQALTHIAVTGDDVKTLLAQNTELTRTVHDLTAEVHRLVVQGALSPAGGAQDLSGVLGEVKAVRALVTQTQPMPPTPPGGSAGTPAGAPQRGKGGTGSRM